MKHFEEEILDPDRMIKVNNLQEITDPIFFKRDNIPTDNGLLSNTIFGSTMYDRANIFAYIDLGGIFINPLIYKTLTKLNGKIKDIVHGTKNFKIINGDLVEDENGETGIKWLYKNYDKIVFKPNTSKKRDINIEFIKKNRKLIFMDKLIVCPPYYRDVNVTSGGRTGIGNINKIYNLILLSVRALKETADYGLNISDSIRGRLQDQIVGVYNWFTEGDDMTTGVVSDSSGLAKKHGLVKKALQSKTADYASRLVISSSSTAFETINDMFVDMDHCGLPLSSALANLLPLIIFNVKKFFDNEFSTGKYPYMTKEGVIEYVTLKDIQVEFNDDKIKHEVFRFIKGYSNRFIPIEVPNVEGKKIYMKFKGRTKPLSEVNDTSGDAGIINRRLTWCDVLYLAAIEAAEGKHVLLTRYPLEDYFGQFPNKIRISSTLKTEVVIIDNKVYNHYPYIREDLILTNTSNSFIDTLQLSNLYLKGIGGDYESCKPIVVFQVLPKKYKTLKQKPLELLEYP